MFPKSFQIAMYALVAVLLSATSSFGQAVSGAINGYVTDPSGAPVSGATVTISNEQTAVRSQATTTGDGFFNATNLLPGDYSVTVEQAGFAKVIREHVRLVVDSTVRVDLSLSVGAVSESITVAAGAELLQSEKVDVSQTLDEHQVQNLPTLGRNITQLYLTVPGALPDSFQMGAGENPSTGVRTYINGTWSGAQEFILDGITDRSYGFSGVQLIVPPVDSVQELKITTADYDPEFGSTTGMVAQFVTKSGTNDLHGTLFYFNRNNATFAADPLTQKIAGTGKDGKGTGVAPYNWNQGGFSLGGPIKKNKLFLFGDYQLTRQIQGASIIATVPNDAFRNGDFSSLPNTIYNPKTGNPDGTGRTPFQGNRIPLGDFNPVAVNLLNLLPLPNISTGTDNNYVGTVKETFNQNWADTRGDWNITDSDKFFVRYSYFSTLLSNPPLFGQIAGGPSQGGLSAENATSSCSPRSYELHSHVRTEFAGRVSRWLFAVQPGRIAIRFRSGNQQQRWYSGHKHRRADNGRSGGNNHRWAGRQLFHGHPERRGHSALRHGKHVRIPQQLVQNYTKSPTALGSGFSPLPVRLPIRECKLPWKLRVLPVCDC